MSLLPRGFCSHERQGCHGRIVGSVTSRDDELHKDILLFVWLKNLGSQAASRFRYFSTSVIQAKHTVKEILAYLLSAIA